MHILPRVFKVFPRRRDPMAVDESGRQLFYGALWGRVMPCLYASARAVEIVPTRGLSDMKSMGALVALSNAAVDAQSRCFV